MKWLLSFIVLWLGTGVLCQGDSEGLVLSDGEPIDSRRYSDAKGSPFLFGDVFTANLVRNDGNIIKGARIRYNGYTREFEAPDGDNFIELDRSWYLRIEVPKADNPQYADEISGDKLIFQRGLHSKFKDFFTILLFNGNDVYLIKEFFTDMKEVVVQDVGKTVKFHRFNPKSYYYIKEKGKIRTVKLKKKSVLDAFDLPGVADYIKQEKLKCTSEEDLLAVTRYYNSLKS